MTTKSFAFQHLRRTDNIGDRAVLPARWFDFGAQVAKLDFADAPPPCDVAVFGGGQVFNQCFDAAMASPARARATWGVGMRNHAGNLRFDLLADRLDLMGCRDVDVPRTVYVPCASCMARAFDAPGAPLHDLVFYLHGKKSDGLTPPEGVPVLTNLGGTLAEKLRFIASGSTVVTNSYHGTYWAMLMGRRVLALPFSSKFEGFARMPATAPPEEWRTALPHAYALDGYRDECRAANRAFYERIINL